MSGGFSTTLVRDAPYNLLSFFLKPMEARMDSHTIAATLEKAQSRSFDQPDEVREFPKGRLELVRIGDMTIGRATLQPGWRWSTSIQPLVNTHSCEAAHLQYHIAGVLKVLMDDGSELECHPGDLSMLPGGHDAWVVGDEPVVVVDFHGMREYARRND